MEKRPPITVRFEIPYFTVSGIQVRYLKIVEKSGYQALPWVRYITQNGDDYRYSLILNPPLLHRADGFLQFKNGIGERECTCYTHVIDWDVNNDHLFKHHEQSLY